MFPQTIKTRGGLETRKYYTNPARTYSRPQFTIWTLEVEIWKLSRVTKGTKRGGGELWKGPRRNNWYPFAVIKTHIDLLL